MEIALVTAWYWPFVGGVEKSVSTLARVLRTRGHSVTIHTSANGNPRGSDVDPYGTPIERYVDAFGAGFIPKLRGSFDVVHLHGTERLLVALTPLLAAPCALTLHNGFGRNATELLGTNYAKMKAWFDRTIGGALLERYRAILCLDETEAERLATLGVSTTRLHTVPNAVDPSALDARKVAERNNYFACVGRLSPEKGQEFLIHAAALSQKPVKIVGSGEPNYERKLRKLASDLGADVEFCGFVDGAQKFELIAKAEALVVASPFEGQSLAILEAMSVGTPVLAPKAASFGLVEDGITGFNYDRANVESLALALKAVPLNRVKTELVAKAAMKFVEERHGIDGIAARHEHIYRTLM